MSCPVTCCTFVSQSSSDRRHSLEANPEPGPTSGTPLNGYCMAALCNLNLAKARNKLENVLDDANPYPPTSQLDYMYLPTPSRSHSGLSEGCGGTRATLAIHFPPSFSSRVWVEWFRILRDVFELIDRRPCRCLCPLQRRFPEVRQNLSRLSGVSYPGVSEASAGHKEAT